MIYLEYFMFKKLFFFPLINQYFGRNGQFSIQSSIGVPNSNAFISRIYLKTINYKLKKCQEFTTDDSVNNANSLFPDYYQ